MIVITGGAGMIGSMIAWHLNNLGRDDLVIVDDIQHPDQWQNLVKRRYQNYLDKSELACFLAGKPKIDAIIHMGAISATTERDFNKLVQIISDIVNSCGTGAQKIKCLICMQVLRLLMVLVIRAMMTLAMSTAPPTQWLRLFKTIL